MKLFNFFRFARIGVLALSILALTTFSAFAQNSNTNMAGTNRTETRTVERDNGTDWGWIGLLGLLGLAGLMPKKRTVEVKEFKDSQTNQTGTAR